MPLELPSPYHPHTSSPRLQFHELPTIVVGTKVDKLKSRELEASLKALREVRNADLYANFY